MSEGAAPQAENTRELLILTAERLFSTRGIEAVSLREIVREAGQKNVAALQYHFGDRLGLFGAILEYRMSRIEERRRAMIEDIDRRGDGCQLRALAACMCRPLVEHLRLEGEQSHYVDFLARLQVSHPDFILEVSQTKPWQENVLAISRRMRELYPSVPAREFTQRLLMLGACMIHSVAEFERGLRSGSYTSAELDSFQEHLIDALCGIVSFGLHSPSP